MKKLAILAGIVLLTVQCATIYLVVQIYNGQNALKNAADSSEAAVKYVSPIMNIEEAAAYAGVTANQLEKMIQIEQKQLNQTHVFSGEMIPYFKVDEAFYFYKDQLDSWLQYISEQNVEYHLGEGYRFE